MPESVRRAVARTVFRRSWDIRARSVPPARLIRPLARRMGTGRGSVLDVGCGQYGLAAFLDPGMVVGTDVDGPGDERREFVRSSILALPFRARAYPLVTCVDVLEHLSPADRAAAVGELVRVADRAVVIACPHGPTAQACDEEFRQACAARDRPLPQWLIEHQRHRYPDRAEIEGYLLQAAAAAGRVVSVSVSYAEHAPVCRGLRAVAARSNLLYLGANLALGALFDALPAPGPSSSYRMMLLAELDPGSPPS